MLERFPNKATIAATVAFGLGTLGLAGCGSSTKEGTWKVGVECPAGAKVVHVDSLNQKPEINGLSGSGEANISVSCADNGSELEPTGFELLAGEGAIVDQASNPTDTITIDYDWKTSDGFSGGDNPVINLLPATHNQHAALVIQGIDKVESVRVG